MSQHQADCGRRLRDHPIAGNSGIAEQPDPASSNVSSTTWLSTIHDGTGDRVENQQFAFRDQFEMEVE
ncbi:hypothetical protein CH256_21595 [Rhodococcus sp. 05-2254-6]|uniref:hypothetical protein n=1 Tax=Nocardiaceae TaxID=85025 RepID=UPI00056D4D7C|nr:MULTISPECIES: hypothetical protein [Rhodococcus]OZE22898.1 hypothetical protein CH256_21595 [Rhodococcus sp. 05-2254-6]OZE87765.1 hypothetical protein CH305_00970 [Rhodococcus sp. 15-649-2-2]OZE89125.1 hypothetical protein CH302_28975 [Rhodococcus sp. 15-2388-1-1a]